MSLDAEDGRFAFGDNWARFLTVLGENRIQEAECSLREMSQVSCSVAVSFGCNEQVLQRLDKRLNK